MGRYRPLVRALVQHTNTVSRTATKRREMAPGIEISSQEWQLLEYVIEHEDNIDNMNRVAEGLGIPQSCISKDTKHLCQIGLLERYKEKDNKKNIILKASQKGRAFYNDFSGRIMSKSFEVLFRELEGLSDEALAQFTHALETYNLSRLAPREKQLVRIEEEE